MPHMGSRTTVKLKIAGLCLAAVANVLGGCSRATLHCMDDDVRAAVGKWRYVGKVGTSGTSSAAGVGRPAVLDLRPDGTFTAAYEAPFPSDVPGGSLSGVWSGGRRCAGLLYLGGTQVGTEPRIPFASLISVDGDVLVLNGATAAFFSARYERSDRSPAGGAAAPEASVSDRTATAAAPPATSTPSGPRPKPTLYNPWRGR